MALNTLESCRGFRMLALVPGGNVARDLALFRRRIFAEFGEASALAYPECVPLACGCLGGLPRPASRPSTPALRGRGSGPDPLARAWDGIDGGFELGALARRDACLCLEVEGPLLELVAASGRFLAGSGIEAMPDPPLALGLGFLLCRFPIPGLEEDEALLRVAALAPPRGRFLDSSLVLYRITRGSAPWSALAWGEEARAHRRSGPRSAAAGPLPSNPAGER
ncbi:MAG TPA: hypothetical protein VFL04_04790 [Rectinemataceae bacterium]|nr:hypothetical protein [Rectinemataceae bacterium]